MRTSSLRIKTFPEYKEFEKFCDLNNIRTNQYLKYILRMIVLHEDVRAYGYEHNTKPFKSLNDLEK
ncbi:hypothetical protein [Nitrosopumilus spindle-shaped virus]|uniref:Uncharacterized protein n=1 Tax=Nitrosopumilus spindle-shaped virus TaxID=2508184 RepID=A0A514K359_9VIRU|nr:hypothetical protein [Nitrosopumilus spindle-shaped virus]